MIFVIYISEENIKEGIPILVDLCPVALSIKEWLGFTAFIGGPSCTLFITDRWIGFEVDINTQEWIYNFDHYRYSTPRLAISKMSGEA
jgi:hypothetical protein